MQSIILLENKECTTQTSQHQLNNLLVRNSENAEAHHSAPVGIAEDSPLLTAAAGTVMGTLRKTAAEDIRLHNHLDLVDSCRVLGHLACNFESVEGEDKQIEGVAEEGSFAADRTD